MPRTDIEQLEISPRNLAILKKALQKALQSIQNWLSYWGGGKTSHQSSSRPFLQLRDSTRCRAMIPRPPGYKRFSLKNSAANQYCIPFIDKPLME
jgi:hypothetical protein